MNEPIRVLLADDHAGVRSTVRSDLEQAGFVVCAEASDAAGAVAGAEREHPDLCLLDVRMPGNGLLAAWDITSRWPGTKVVMLTTSRNEEHELAALRAGAVGYVLKDVEDARLADALRAFAAGEVSITPSVASRLLELIEPDRPGVRRVLRRRVAPGPPDDARRLLEVLSRGLPIPDAADRLGISMEAARAELSEVLARLRYAGREDLRALSSLNA